MVEIKGSVADLIHLLEKHAGETVIAHLEFEETTHSLCGQHQGPGHILTIDEVAERLGFGDRKCPREAVKYLHRMRRLRGVLVSGRLRWRAGDVDDYLRRCGKA